MKYQVLFKSGGFEIENLKTQQTSKASFQDCFNSKASSKIKGKHYEIKPRSTWGDEFEVYEEGKLSGSIKTNWQSNVQIDFADQSYIIKNIGVLNGFYVVEDDKQHELITLKPHFKLKRLADDYEVTKKNNHENVNLLIFLSAFSVQYYEANMYL